MSISESEATILCLIPIFTLLLILSQQSTLGCIFFPFSTLNIACHSLLAYKVCAEKSAIILAVVSLDKTLCSTLAAFRISSELYHFGEGMFCFTLFGTLCPSYTQKYVSFFRFGKFSAIILSNTVSTLFSLYSSPETPVM